MSFYSFKAESIARKIKCAMKRAREVYGVTSTLGGPYVELEPHGFQTYYFANKHHASGRQRLSIYFLDTLLLGKRATGSLDRCENICSALSISINLFEVIGYAVGQWSFAEIPKSAKTSPLSLHLYNAIYPIAEKLR